ncbi:MAG: hypothetical protein OXC83_06055 [Chloroflexi bacterium]|nr:hypothetical protein [Chloroflexota bacterium]
MVSVTFDTHRVVKDLRDAGFDEAQAEAVVNALGSAVDRDVVKPVDLKEFATKADLAQAIAELRTEMKAMELRLTVRLTGVMIATAGLTVAILKLFP